MDILVYITVAINIVLGLALAVASFSDPSLIELFPQYMMMWIYPAILLFVKKRK